MKGHPKKRRKIVISVFLFGLVLYVVSLLWLLPSFLKDPINDQLKHNNLHIDYQRLWINPLTLNIHLYEAQLKDLSGQMILSAEKIDVDWQLWPLINRHIIIDQLFLKQASIHLEFDHNNQLILPSFNSAQSESSQWQFSPGQIEVINSSVSLKRQQQRLQLNGINLNLNLADLINADNKATSQSASLQFETDSNGVFSIKQNAGDQFFHWQLNDWPLQQMTPWMLSQENDVELSGHVTASGILNWPANQMPIIQIANTELTIKQLNWPPFSTQQAQIIARNIRLDLNAQHVGISHIESHDGELAIEIDPLNLVDIQSIRQASDNNWQTQIDSLIVNDWIITLKDKRPAVKAVIEQLTLQTENQQQKLTVQAKLTAPFAHPIRIDANGQVQPFQLQGEIKADTLELETLNPWLEALSPWQIQQAPLSVNSRFCLQNEAIFAKGDWTISKLSLTDGNQRIDATQTTLQSIGLNFNQQLLTLNDITNQSLEIYQLNTDVSTQPTEKTATTPQSTNQLWQVMIDDGFEGLCKINSL